MMRFLQLQFLAVLITSTGLLHAQNSDLIVGSNTSGNSTNFTFGTNAYSNTYVGYDSSSSNNQLTVGNINTLLTNSGNLYVGYYGSNNSLIISNGGRVVDQNGSVGFHDDGNTALVTGTNSLWSNASSFYVGNCGSYAQLIVSNGGGVISSNGYIAEISKWSNCAAVITGTGSYWSNTGTLTIGSVANGGNNPSSGNSLLISGGGCVTDSNAVIANATNFYSNSVTVTGVGSLWSNAGSLTIGAIGAANRLVISDGARVVDQAGYVGASNTSTGNTVLVTGTNSLWSNTSILIIGGQGSGTVTVANGGVLSAASIQIGQFGDLDFGRYQQNDSAGSVVGNIVFTANNDENYGINFNQSDTLYLTNRISGPGWLCQLGTGTTVISGSNSFSQYTKIDAGTLVAASTNALGSGSLGIGGYADRAVIQLQNNLTVGDFIWGSNGIVALTAGSQTLTVDAMTNAVGTNGGNVFSIFNPSMSNGTNTLISFTSQSGFTTNSFGVEGISGYSFAITNNSIQAFIPNNANVTISMPVVVTNAFNAGSVTIAGPSGCISGTGSINASVTNGGTLIPGFTNGTPGTMTINGNYTQTAAGTLQIQVGKGAYSLLNVSGAAVLGGTLTLTPVAGHVFQFGDKIVFLSAATITGNFSSVEVPTGFRGRVKVFGDPQLEVIMAPVSYTQMAQNRNQSNVATALNSFIPYTSGNQLVVSTSMDSLTAPEYNQAFNAIMPTFYQQIVTIAFNEANALNMELNQRLWGLRLAEGGGFSMNGMDNMPMLEGQGDGAGSGKGVLDSKIDILRPGADNHWGMFVDANGIFANANSGNMLPGYNAQSGGINAGLTYKWNDSFASGLYCGYQGTYSKMGANGSGLGTGSSLIDNAVRFGVFGTYGHKDGKGLYGNALAGGAYHNFQATRVIQYTGMNRTPNSSPGAGELDSMLAAGYDIQKGKFTFGPTASLQYTYLGVNKVNETGAQSLNFNSGGWNSSSMLSSVGAHAAYNWQAGKNVVVVPQISLNWQHEFMQNPYDITGNLGGTSPTFSNTSATGIRDYLYTGVGFIVEIGKRWNTSFFYNAAAGKSDLTSQNIFWSAGAKF